MSKKTFLQGAIVLGAAGLVIKVMGAFFRIPLANIIGDEGMGYYQTAYPIYVFLLVFSTSGIPTAISKLVSERMALGNYAGAHRIFKVSFVLLLALGASTAGILFFGAGTIASLLKNPGAYASLAAISPALLLAPIMAAFRGYFQGMQNMNPTAASQLIEQFFRVSAGLGLAWFLLSRGLTYAAAGASFGAAAGTVGGVLAVGYIYLSKRSAIAGDCRSCHSFPIESAKSILYKISIIAVPITLGAAIMPVMSMIDVAIVMRRLQESGFSQTVANGLYGQLSGMAAPLINFPQALTAGIAMSLVPAIAAANQNKDVAFMQYNIGLGIRTAMIISLPCTIGMMILSKPIMLLLYPMQTESASSASACLFILAAGIVLLALIQTLTGTLQGLGRQVIPVRNLLLGAVFKIGCTFMLVGMPGVNVKGAAAGTIAAYAVAAALNFYAVKKYTDMKFDLGLLIGRPFVSALCMGVFVYISYYYVFSGLRNSLATVLSIFIGVVVYGAAIFATKSITAQELAILPKGSKLQKIAKKLKKS